MSVKTLYRNYSKAGKKKTVGFGYVGRWKNGTLGWFLPTHLCGRRDGSEHPNDEAGVYSNDDDRFALCRITIEQVPGAREIRHRNRRRG